MTAIKGFIQQQATPSYFILVLALTGGTALAVFGPGGLPVAPEQRETMGMAAAMLAGPSLAGLLLIGLVEGRRGYRDLQTRLLRWRVGAHWWALALLSAPLLYLAIGSAGSLIAPEFLPAIFTASDKTSLLLSGAVAGLMVGIFEELGWTGFAVPRLRLRHSILATGLMLGLVWGAWHFLMFWESDSFLRTSALALLIARLFSWLPAYRVLMVWVYDRTESLLLAILMHASATASVLIFAVPATGASLLAFLLVSAAAWWLVVAVVAATTGGQFSRRPGSPSAGPEWSGTPHAA